MWSTWLYLFTNNKYGVKSMVLQSSIYKHLLTFDGGITHLIVLIALIVHYHYTLNKNGREGVVG